MSLFGYKYFYHSDAKAAGKQDNSSNPADTDGKTQTLVMGNQEFTNVPDSSKARLVLTNQFEQYNQLKGKVAEFMSERNDSELQYLSPAVQLSLEKKLDSFESKT